MKKDNLYVGHIIDRHIVDMKKVILIIPLLFGAVSLAGCSQSPVSQTQDDTQQSSQAISEVKNSDIEKDNQLKALLLIQNYETKSDITQGIPPITIKKGTSLVDLFSALKSAYVILDDSRWYVVKDNNRYVIKYQGNFSGIYNGLSLNNPQWVVLVKNDVVNFSDAKIEALNGTAKSYTPELGGLDPSEASSESLELKMYRRFQEISKTPAYLSRLEGDDIKDYEKANEEIGMKIASEFHMSIREAGIAITEGGLQYGKALDNERGDVVSDEKYFKLLKEQGDNWGK